MTTSFPRQLIATSVAALALCSLSGVAATGAANATTPHQASASGEQANTTGWGRLQALTNSLGSAVNVDVTSNGNVQTVTLAPGQKLTRNFDGVTAINAYMREGSQRADVASMTNMRLSGGSTGSGLVTFRDPQTDATRDARVSGSHHNDPFNIGSKTFKIGLTTNSEWHDPIFNVNIGGTTETSFPNKADVTLVNKSSDTLWVREGHGYHPLYQGQSRTEQQNVTDDRDRSLRMIFGGGGEDEMVQLSLHTNANGAATLSMDNSYRDLAVNHDLRQKFTQKVLEAKWSGFEYTIERHLNADGRAALTVIVTGPGPV